MGSLDENQLNKAEQQFRIGNTVNCNNLITSAFVKLYIEKMKKRYIVEMRHKIVRLSLILGWTFNIYSSRHLFVLDFSGWL